MFRQTKIAKLQLFLPNISPTLNLIFVSMAHMLRSLHDFVVDSQEIWPFQGFESLDATNHDQSDGGMVISTWCRNAWERKPWIIYSGITWVFPKIGVPMVTPKWMVYNGKPYSNGWFGCTTIFGNIHIDVLEDSIWILYAYTDSVSDRSWLMAHDGTWV